MFLNLVNLTLRVGDSTGQRTRAEGKDVGDALVQGNVFRLKLLR